MTGIRGFTGWLGVVLGSPDPRRLAGFYRDLLGWEIANEDPTWVTMQMRDGDGKPIPANLAFQLEKIYQRPVWPNEDGKQQMQFHLDVGVTDVEAAVEDAVALGAAPAGFQPQDDVRVMLDPDGHPFCLYLDA
ncbi:VOC family protein [Microlunatus sp. Gsoil 973]|uniref:VOC family protein n=1 Tax=Microlunatus sp. Gsoil 973 TaxID=2672569 RepID=UPI0012B4E932|nr:VOC family protein [Microlunatus sp. Gsoil 973]QGN33142.1 VOC family protein [Microlunatus sp. Gsoil 973]